MIGRLFRGMICKAAEDAAIDRVAHFLAKQAPSIILESARKRFSQSPNMELSNAGFGMAMSLALMDIWPDIDLDTAAKWMWEYVENGASVSKSDWTPETAKILARLYANEFGEVP